MKWLHLIAIGSLAFAFGACQQHSKDELSLIEMPGEHAAPAKPQKNGHESTSPSDESKPAPSYF